MFRLIISKKYIWLPIKTGAEKTQLSIFKEADSKAQKLFELQIPAATENFDFYAALNVEQFKGQVLLFCGDLPEKWFLQIELHGKRPPLQGHIRPKLHFTAESGWINDPNGLIYDNGIYHLYFQCNPFEVEWGDMHWGHAVSKDLIHWEQKDTALFPDENGTAFSGCAIKDEKNLLKLGENALLFFYTAAGGASLWSNGKNLHQRLAYSLDAGEHLQKYRVPVIHMIEKDNRDPKIFWHSESGAYIMVLYLQENEFAILRSQNLKKWEISQRLILNGAWECPDLFELTVCETSERHWVFWSADGFYFIGDFDGYRFSPTSERQSAYIGTLPYAAQTYSGVKNRIISIAWLRTKNRESLYTGMMSLPSELSLIKTQQGLQLQLSPVRELAELRSNHVRVGTLTKGDNLLAQAEDRPYELFIRLAGQNKSQITFQFSNCELSVDFDHKICRLQEQELHVFTGRELDFHIIVDVGVIEFHAQNDIIYYICENMVEHLSGPISAIADEVPEKSSIDIFYLK